MHNTIENIKIKLTGDKLEIKTEAVIEICEAAIKLKEPNITGDSWYTYEGNPIAQTPLTMALEKIIIDNNSRLKPLIIALLKAGADVLVCSNFEACSAKQKWDMKLKSCLLQLMERLPDCVLYINKEILNKSLEPVLSDLNLNLSDLNLHYLERECDIINTVTCNVVLISLLNILPDIQETYEYLFNIILLKIRLSYRFPENSNVQDTMNKIREIIVSKLSKVSALCELFQSCWNNNTLSPWIEYFPKSINWKVFSKLLYERKMPTAEYNAYFSQLLQQNLITNLYRLEMFDIAGRETITTWENMLKNMIVSKPVRIFPSKQNVSQFQKAEESALCVIHHDIKSKTLVFTRILGRTLLFENTRTKKIIALKVQKKSETMEEMEKEASTLMRLRLRKDLSSKLPKPISISCKLSRDEILEFIRNSGHTDEISVFRKMINDNENPHIYYYEVEKEDSGYFIYLHDPSLTKEDFAIGCRRSIHDLAKLLKEDGLVFSQLADIFHNTSSSRQRTDSGRYLVLAPLIRRSNDVKRSGRVDKWQKAVEFVNLRLTGLADVGDSCQFYEYQKFNIFQEITSSYNDRFAKLPRSEHADEFIYANLLAEYLFIFTLVCGRRGVEISKTNPSVNLKSLWLEIAEQVINNSAQLLSELTAIPEMSAKETITKCIDINILAKQMAYWMTSHYANEPLTKEKFEELYPGANLSAAPFNPTSKFSDEGKLLGIRDIGFSNDGVNQDLGGFNQQNPMTEDNKMYYFIASLVRLFSDMGSQYREATFEFESAVENSNFEEANEALFKLKRNTYPHARWQHLNNVRKKEILISHFPERYTILDISSNKPPPDESKISENNTIRVDSKKTSRDFPETTPLLSFEISVTLTLSRTIIGIGVLSTAAGIVITICASLSLLAGVSPTVLAVALISGGITSIIVGLSGHCFFNERRDDSKNSNDYLTRSFDSHNLMASSVSLDT